MGSGTNWGAVFISKLQPTDSTLLGKLPIPLPLDATDITRSYTNEPEPFHEPLPPSEPMPLSGPVLNDDTQLNEYIYTWLDFCASQMRIHQNSLQTLLS